MALESSLFLRPEPTAPPAANSRAKGHFSSFNLSPPAPLTVSFLPGSITLPVIPEVESSYTGHIRHRQSERLHFSGRDELLLIRGVGVAPATKRMRMSGSSSLPSFALPTLQTPTARVPDQLGAQSQLHGRFGPRTGLCHRSDTSLVRPEV